MPRLDWIYIFNYLASNQASNDSHYFVKGDGIKSDCHLVNCVLEFVKIAQRTSIEKWIPGSLERLKRKFTKIWKAQPEKAIFVTKLRKVIKFYKKNYKGCKTPQKGIWAKQNLKCVQGSLQDMVQDKGLQQQVNTLKLKIKELINEKATKHDIKVRFTWKQKNCTIMKNFFTTIKPKLNKVGISILKDDIKAITKNQI